MSQTLVLWLAARHSGSGKAKEAEMQNRDVLISGASVAGPALAYWLHRHGFNPAVIERAPAPRPGGQAIDVRGTARQVIERMGLMDQVRRAHTGARGMAFVDSENRRLATMDPQRFGDSGGLIADIEILRGDLVRILHEATRDRVEYLFDDSVTGVGQASGGVHVTFARRPARTFHLVVGADGLHSNVRSLVFGPESQFLRDLGCYVAIFRTFTELRLDGWELMYSVPGKNGVRGRTVGLYPLPDPDQAIAMFYFASASLGYERSDVDRQKRLLAETFAGDGWEVGRLLEGAWDASDFYFDRVCQVQLDSWSRDRAVLLGDAGYCGSPLGGNGTSLALVGAYVLAGELAAAGGEHRTAFARYEAAMRDYVTGWQNFARKAPRSMLPRSRWEIWIRNQVIKLMPHLPVKDPSGLQGLAGAVNLESYEPAGSTVEDREREHAAIALNND
jgi:2-polyprenyl-6-methoxyphenol hydroxylase-like FAD-dependent oxidoreductase